MCQRLTDGYLVGCITQLVAALLKTVHHLVFCYKSLDYTQSAKRLFQLRHGITPFSLGFQRLTLQFLADFSHQPAHTRQYQDSKQSQLPAGYNQSGKIKQNQDRILEQHIQ